MKLFSALLMAAGLCSFTASGYAAETPCSTEEYGNSACLGKLTDLSDVAWGAITLDEDAADLDGKYGMYEYVPYEEGCRFCPYGYYKFVPSPLSNLYFLAQLASRGTSPLTITLWNANGDFIADYTPDNLIPDKPNNFDIPVFEFGGIRLYRDVHYTSGIEETFYFSVSFDSNTRNGTSIADGFLYDGQTLGGSEHEWGVFIGHGGMNVGSVITQPGTAATILSGPPILSVPEPETYAMMMAGFGLLGAAARRRRKMA